MATTYTLISSYTVGSGGSAQVDFTSIPQTYTDLLIKTSTNVNSLNVLRIRLNSTSSDYTQKVLRGTGGATNSYSDTGWDTTTYFSPGYNNEGTNIFSNNEYYIPNYTSSNFKSFSGDSATEANSSTAYLVLYSGLLSNTAAVTSINFIPQSGNFNQYSTFYLYGISNA